MGRFETFYDRGRLEDRGVAVDEHGKLADGRTAGKLDAVLGMSRTHHPEFERDVLLVERYRRLPRVG
jgi:hypothetical protein